MYYLKFVHGGCWLCDLSISFEHLCQFVRQSGPLDLDVDLPGGDGPQGFDQLQLLVLGDDGAVEDPLTAFLNHLSHGGFDLNVAGNKINNRIVLAFPDTIGS